MLRRGSAWELLWPMRMRRSIACQTSLMRQIWIRLKENIDSWPMELRWTRVRTTVVMMMTRQSMKRLSKLIGWRMRSKQPWSRRKNTKCLRIRGRRRGSSKQKHLLTCKDNDVTKPRLTSFWQMMISGTTIPKQRKVLPLMLVRVRMMMTLKKRSEFRRLSRKLKEK